MADISTSDPIGQLTAPSSRWSPLRTESVGTALGELLQQSTGKFRPAFGTRRIAHAQLAANRSFQVMSIRFRGHIIGISALSLGPNGGGTQVILGGSWAVLARVQPVG